MDFHIFDAEYVRRLADGDPATESHFSAYFNKFLFLKLRARRVLPEMAEDVRQETLLRVLKALRQGPGVAHPERFGAFVNAVCGNVLLEFVAKQSRHPLMQENAPEPVDSRIDMEGSLISDQRKQLVANVLTGLAEKDREILRMVFLEEIDRKEVCERLGVQADYLRVLVHRAKLNFEEALRRKHGMAHRVS